MTFRFESAPANWAGQEAAANMTLLSPDEWAQSRPDVHCLLIEAGLIVARCSIWLHSLPEHEAAQPAAVGHFEACKQSAGTAVLEAAIDWIHGKGQVPIIGPINGTTWQKYRFVTESSGRVPFLLEPTHPDFYVAAWRDAGFEPLAAFHSASMPPQSKEDPRLTRVKARMEAVGLRIRNLRIDDYESELRRLYSVARISFAENLLYTPVSEAEFIAMYQPIRASVNPDLVWLAEQGERCVGFCFCLPDLLQAQWGEAIDSLIVKTLATLPERDFAGLGLWLTQLAHQAAKEIGFSSVIHALMHPGSRIKNFGKDEMEIFRRYTLYQLKG
jgi:GNAT superfamily N-acetyltransferase